MGKLTVGNASSNNPEDATTGAAAATSTHVYHGMGQVENKNYVQDLTSRKQDWNTLKVPEFIQAGLAKLHYFKPSII